VLRSHRGEGAEDDQIQRALQELDAVACFTGHRSGTSTGASQVSVSTGMSGEIAVLRCCGADRQQGRLQLADILRPER
jgi:hypothetical protein